MECGIEKVDYKNFKMLVDKYKHLNSTYNNKIIFFVGTGAGLYSELGSMLECISYCYVNKIQFILYADNANFSNKNGWLEFFDEFCEINHDSLNRYANYRYKKYFRWKGVPLPNLIFRRIILPKLIKKRNNVQYLTQDVFDKFTSLEFKEKHIEWKEFGICGTVRDEYAKLRYMALHYNKKTTDEIKRKIKSVNLPKNYISIQIRGGDKSIEFKQLIDTETCLKKIDEWGIGITDLFVFTDDYRNVIKIRQMRPDWNIYTLCREDERGYYNDSFNKVNWEYKRDNLIKLFAMVEICINSELHLGCSETCVNNFIRSAKKPEQYLEFERGERRKKLWI